MLGIVRRLTRIPFRHRAASTLLLAILVSTAASAPAAAETLRLNEHLWIPNGTVRAMAVSGNTIYAGGTFDYVGPSTGGFTSLDRQTAVPREGWPSVDRGPGTGVRCSAPDGAGGWYVGGSFKSVAGVNRWGLAHIRADHTLDSWNPTGAGAQYLEVTVNTIAVTDSVVYVGGRFTAMGGQNRNGLAAVSRTTGLATAWNPAWDSGSNVWFHAITATGPTVYVAGIFSSLGGASRHGLAAIDAETGLASDWDPSPDGGVTSVLVRDSVVYVGGNFAVIGWRNRHGVAALDPVTGIAKDWYPQVEGLVNAMAFGGPTLYVGGSLSTAGGQPRTNLAAIDVATGAVTSWNPDANDEVLALATDGSVVYVGGYFTGVGGQDRRNLAALDPVTGLVTAWNPGASNDVVTTLGFDGQALCVGGKFSSVGGRARRNLAAFDAITGRATDWDPAPDADVLTLAVSAGTVYVCGSFARIGGEERTWVAAIDAVSGHATAWNPAPDGPVYAFLPNGSSIYLGGGFTNVGGQRRTGLAAIDVATGLPTAWNPAIDGSAYSLARAGSTLFVAGNFAASGGNAREGLVAVDVTTGSRTAWNPGADGSVQSIALLGSTLYAAGEFTHVGGQSRHGLAALGLATGLATAWNPAPNSTTKSLAVSDSIVYAAGSFSSIGGASRSGAAGLDPTTGLATSWPGPGIFYVERVVTGPGRVVLGGYFDYVGLIGRRGLASFEAVTDSAAPTVQVLSPNGGERFVVGELRTITWSAGDESGVTSVDVWLSRNGSAGPWEPLVMGTSNAGSFVWRVTGPATAGSVRVRVVAWDPAGNAGRDESDAPFTIADDATAPVVRVLSPNGYETIDIGHPLEITWTASDDIGVQSVDLRLSRGSASGPWELIASAVPNTGEHTWVVTGPMAVAEAYVRVDARDYSGNVGSDLSDQPFTILERSVPTLIELFRAAPVSNGIRVEWQASEAALSRLLALERAGAADGEWSLVAAPAVTEGRITSVLDTDVEVGRTLWYRLTAAERGGSTVLGGPVSATMGTAITAFRLDPLAPNPTSGRSLVSFTVPTRARVRLTLADLQGRVLAVLADGYREPGYYTAALETADLEAGIYFMRLESAGRAALTRRVIVLR